MIQSEDRTRSSSAKQNRGSFDATDRQMLNYIKEEELIRCVGPDHYLHLKANLAKAIDKKLTLKDIKREIASN